MFLGKSLWLESNNNLDRHTNVSTKEVGCQSQEGLDTVRFIHPSEEEENMYTAALHFVHVLQSHIGTLLGNISIAKRNSGLTLVL